ncbi:SurA N-terminal domain-containing protein, partial [Halobacillus sp. BBL2006]|uniref:SurA N-terminal domain-containing protein n=1 Tax=Halobacillus sp. BBL2006 TaxID=1543706 RepID=UPI000689DEFD
MKKLFMTLTLSTLAVFGLAACSSGEEAEKDKDSQQTEENKAEDKSSDELKGSGPVAVVNGEELSREDFNAQYESMKQQYTQMGMDLEGKEEQLKKSIVDQMIGSELLTQSAEEAGIEVSNDEVEKKYSEFSKRFESEEQMKKAFEENNTDEKEVKEQLKLQIKVDEYIANNTEEPEVSEEELKQEYDALKQKQEEIE